MAALFFIAFSAIRDLYYLSPSFKNILSVREAIEEIQHNRKSLLFDKYCRQLWNLKQITGAGLLYQSNMETGREAFEFLQHERAFQYQDSADFEKLNEIEIISAEEVDACFKRKSTFFDHDDPELIYENHSLGEIREGVSFIVSGTTLHNCERFSINLILDTPTRDIALHFNPRLPQNYIVRNCKIKNVWSTEEVASTMPFILERGREFSIQILITEQEYLISINGHHFAEYPHRLPFSNIKCLEVKGDVKDIKLERTIEKEYPKRMTETLPVMIRSISGIENADEAHSGKFDLNTSVLESTAPSSNVEEFFHKKGLQMPYYGKLSENFQSGQRINIEGRIKILPHSFFINLQSGNNIWPHPVISFHFNPRFAVGGKNSRHVICKNSWANGKWNQEERSEISCEFAPGRDFSLGLCAGDSCYEVYLNEKFIANYQHRIAERNIDTIYIQGDVHIWNVNLVTDASPTESQTVETIQCYRDTVNSNNTNWV